MKEVHPSNTCTNNAIPHTYQWKMGKTRYYPEVNMHLVKDKECQGMTTMKVRAGETFTGRKQRRTIIKNGLRNWQGTVS